MKKLIFLLAICLSSVAFGQSITRESLLASGTTLTATTHFFTARVLTQEERDNLVNDIDFRKKCEWAISDYASYWVTHDGSGLSTDARAKWRREYELVKLVWKSEYNDPVLAKRFVTLAKGRQYDLSGSPTVQDIITAMVADGSFDAIASQYFDMLTQ